MSLIPTYATMFAYFSLERMPKNHIIATSFIFERLSSSSTGTFKGDNNTLMSAHHKYVFLLCLVHFNQLVPQSAGASLWLPTWLNAFLLIPQKKRLLQTFPLIIVVFIQSMVSPSKNRHPRTREKSISVLDIFSWGGEAHISNQKSMVTTKRISRCLRHIVIYASINVSRRSQNISLRLITLCS